MASAVLEAVQFLNDRDVLLLLDDFWANGYTSEGDGAQYIRSFRTACESSRTIQVACAFSFPHAMRAWRESCQRGAVCFGTTIPRERSANMKYVMQQC